MGIAPIKIIPDKTSSQVCRGQDRSGQVDIHVDPCCCKSLELPLASLLFSSLLHSRTVSDSRNRPSKEGRYDIKRRHYRLACCIYSPHPGARKLEYTKTISKGIFYLNFESSVRSFCLRSPPLFGLRWVRVGAASLEMPRQSTSPRANNLTQ